MRNAPFSANVAGVMPTYSVLEGATWKGRPVEQVGAGFNKTLLTDMLRGQYGFRGLVITDWGITNDCNDRCRGGAPRGERPSFADLGMPWGVEDRTMRGRFVQAVQAGVTSLWEVTLYPGRPGIGPPLWVVMPGRNSGVAAEEAMASHPGYTVGPIRKVSY